MASSQQCGVKTAHCAYEQGRSLCAGSDELLKELNSGSAGWLKDEEEADWGLDDVAGELRPCPTQRPDSSRPVSSRPHDCPTAEHARNRQQQDAARGLLVAKPEGGTSAGRRRGPRATGNLAADEVASYASPVSAGLARIADGDEQLEAAEQLPSGAARRPSGLGPAAGPGAPSASAAAGGAVTAVELEASYARRNPGVVQVSRLRRTALRQVYKAATAGRLLAP